MTMLRSLAVAVTAFATLIASTEAHAQSARGRAAVHRPAAVHRARPHRPPTYRAPTANRNVSKGYTGLRPGYGTPVVGGRYVPGYGVIGTPPTPVVGGSYVPGFGVTGGAAGTPVVGGRYVPGYGVTGGTAGTQSVLGGTTLPGTLNTPPR